MENDKISSPHHKQQHDHSDVVSKHTFAAGQVDVKRSFSAGPIGRKRSFSAGPNDVYDVTLDSA